MKIKGTTKSILLTLCLIFVLSSHSKAQDQANALLSLKDDSVEFANTLKNSKVQENTIRISPNPANTGQQIKISKINLDQSIDWIGIYTTEGKELYKSTKFNDSISASLLSGGLYYVLLKENDIISYEKLLVY